MRYKDAPESIRDIARDLDVDAVIEGSVLRSGNQVRITAQLIDGATDEHLWAESYDRDLEDVLSLLSDVSRAISGEIHTTLVSESEKGEIQPPRINPEAYETYLRGRHAFGTFELEGQIRAFELYERAIELDPDFAPAWASLATAQILRAFFSPYPGEFGIQEARASALRALELDPDLGEAHAALGFISLYSDWDWQAAERELQRALAVSPNDASVRHAYADYLFVMGKPEDSLEQVRLGRSYDPFSRLANQIVVYHAFMAGHFDEVIVEGRRMHDRFPDFQGGHNIVGHALWALGRYDEALAEYEVSWGPERFRIFNEAFERQGPEGAWKAMADRLVQRAKTKPVSPLDIAENYAAAGENDLAFEWMDRAFDARSAPLLHVPFNPFFDPIRSDPRFDALMDRIGISRVSE